MTTRTKNAIDIFLDALNTGTLAKGSCTACAVGNLVAAGLDGTITITDDGRYVCDKSNDVWSELFNTHGVQKFYGTYLQDVGVLANIEATEFTLKELMEIEYTFETNTEIRFTDYPKFSNEEIRKDQINGLQAVVEVMLEFEESKEDVKEIFTKKAELILI